MTGSANPNGKIPQSYDVFLCSAEFAETNGGTSGIVDLARSMKAKKLMVIGHDESDQFSVSHEMNGKLIGLACQNQRKPPLRRQIIACKWQ